MARRHGVSRGAGIGDEDLDFIHDAQALIQRRQKRGWQGWTPWLAVVMLGICIWWATWAELDEVTRGQGKVIPSKSVQLIQSLEGGILEELYVEEGQSVEEGQNLARIRDAIFASSYQENLARSEILAARLVRLKAELEGSADLRFPPDIRPDLAAMERTVFEKRRTDYRMTEASLRSRLNLLEQEEALLRGGIESKAISPVELIRTQKEKAEIEGSLSALRTSFERQASEELGNDLANLETVTQAIKRDKDRLDRTLIRAPVRGIVNKININTVGRVVASGADIMSIVPSDDSLLVEANIRPSDIAFIRPVAPAKVKFTAYDFTIYGGLEGRVERIGADTVTDESGHSGHANQNSSGQQGASYYPITVRTEKNSLGYDRHGKELTIIPGMIAEVDILTGKKTVLTYLLRPLNRARERALRER